MALQTTDALNRTFADLKSKSEDVRLRGAYDLYRLVATASRELPPDKFQSYYTNVNQRIAHFIVTSSDSNEKIGGILAVEQLINFDGDDAAQKTTRFAGYLRAALRSNDNTVLVFAARALGRLAIPGGALTAELVESEVRSALEWMQSDRQESRRFAAVLILRDLARNSPTLLYAFVPEIFDCIWAALRDSKVLIRETAAEAIGACFEIISARDAQLRQHWFSRMYEEAQQGLKSGTLECLHGSLLTIKELLLKGGMFMQDHYRGACDIVLRLKDHKEPRIRTQIVVIVPILAAYAPIDFAQTYLHRFMTYLQGQLKKDKERNAAFIAIGKIANAVTSSIGPYLDGIIVFVREGLSVKARNRVGTDEGPVFQCISMLSVAVGQTLSKYMEALLDPMFACGLSKSLTQALVDMACYIHPIKPLIQEKLLDLLSLVLSGRPFKPLGTPEHWNPPIPAFAKDYGHQVAEHKESEIALALETLGSFDFGEHQLNEFVRDVAIRYVDNSNAGIRKASALTCCQLYIRDPVIKQTSFHALRVVADVVKRLLTVAVGDIDPDIRRTVLLSLDTRFDRHLSKPENIRSIFLAINDGDFEVRQAAIIIIGRMTNVNPAYVFPALRKLLVNLMMGISSSHDPRHEEECARLISLFIANTSQLVKPYVDPLVKTLLPKASDPNASVASAALKAIGELATIGGSELLPYLPKLMPTIVEGLQDLSSQAKREAALHALGQLTSNSGYVIQPYLDHPHLLDLLTNIIKSEQQQGTLRKETIKLLGILGALDPYRHQQIMETSPELRLKNDNQTVSDVSLIMQGLTPSNEEYYPTVVMNTLLQNVLKDVSLVQYHSTAIEAIVTVFKTLGLKCVPFLGQIVPSFVIVIRNAPPTRLELYFNQLAILVTIVRQHIRPFVQQLLELVQEYWATTTQIQATVLSLVEALSRSLNGEFKPYIARVLPLMLNVLEKDSSIRRIASEKVIHTILVFGQTGEEYMHMIIPMLVRMFQKQQNPVVIRKAAIDTIGKISRQVNISDYASVIIHNLTDVIGGKEQTLRQAALDCLCALIFQLGTDYLLYMSTVKKVLVASHLPHHTHDVLVSKLRKGEPLPQDLSPDDHYGVLGEDTTFADVGMKKLPVNQEHLKNAWEASQKSTREDWQEWMRRFSVELLKESPHHALRACANLAGVYQNLAKDLFNAAFVSCWTELFEQYQEELLRSLEIALVSPHLPPEILQVLLNLAEFMEHDDKALPIDIRTLGKYAAKCHAFAKALHYKELEFEEEKTPGTVEALIYINNQLQQSDAAVGILRNAQKYRDFELKETWFEKLERWEEALNAYTRRENEEPDSFEVTMGKMRCLHALGEWDMLSNLAEGKWNLASIDHKRAIAPLAAAAAWGLGQWELMDNYLEAMKSQSPDRSFFGAILAIHRNQFQRASEYIEKAREALDTELTALLGESYNRAYGVVVRVQMLAELEEIITYKKSEGNPVKQATMRNTWTRRLKGCQRNPEVWQRMLKVRALVITPSENIDMWIKFANLCRKSGRIALAEKSLHSLRTVGNDDSPSSLISKDSGVPEVLYAQLKYKWATGEDPSALQQLRDFTAELSYELSAHNSKISEEKKGQKTINIQDVNAADFQRVNALGDKKPLIDPSNITKLLAKCYLKQGEWLTTLKKGDWRSEHVHEIIASYANATTFNRGWYKAWHAWALANFEVVTAITSQANRETANLSQQVIADHVVPAVRGFFKSIALSSTSSLQDTLRLLTLWFAHGGDHEVNAAVTEGFSTVSIDTWLEVIPQLIARINQPNNRVRQSIHRLLAEVGKAHPQALVYPLTVAMKSSVTRRSHSASQIMDSMRQHSPNLVEQADTVSQELIRVAVLWHELWHEGLEEASRLYERILLKPLASASSFKSAADSVRYFGDRDVDGMIATLAPLHDQVKKGAETLREISFVQAFGRELSDARNWCDRYRATNEISALNQAWDLYYSVFRRIARQLPHLMTLDLTYVSPKLKEARNLDLAVPGTYHSGKSIIRILSFDHVFTVIPSKQRPRKMTLRGSDGIAYAYLLKGHEDIRQDERVMQLFGLVNTLLTNDSESFKRHLNIQPFPVIPLSQNSGLLGWVPNSDTLHNLIKDYREARRILLNIEHRIMLQMAPDYDNLTLMQKVEVFSYAMDNTTGKDLYRVLWLKSKSSESWLQRRTNYTRSLAVMSMVGYILGLGDRHPSNLMLDRITGKIIHIDFGDCFEVAMHREKYPERVPFRLTRMLTFAMEVSNIDGSYKISCEAVMRVIRDNKESLMAVLEAFIHDPLLNWRLGNRESPPEPSFHSERRASIINGLDGAQQVLHVQPLRSGGSYRARRMSAAAFDAGGLDPTGSGPGGENREVQNERALKVLERVKVKLTGRDFKPEEELNVERQVAKLIGQATSVENLCQHYIGWCSFW